MHPLPHPRSSPTMATTRVHPSESDADLHLGGGGEGGRESRCAADRRRQPAAVSYTVWKRSSMGFQGTDGFTVYDAAGSLAFRVDNYSRRPKLFAGELVLMDGYGAPLLALRPQILSLRDQWNCYRASSEEEETGSGGGDKGNNNRRQLLFSMRKRYSLLQSGTDDEAEVHMFTTAPSSSSGHHHHLPTSFRVQGSFWRRSCKIRKGNGEEVARITRKRAGGGAGAASSSESVTTLLGDDVFSLTVMPGADPAMIMAFVVIMDRICHKPYTTLMCS